MNSQLDGVDIETLITDILKEDGHLELPDCYRIAVLLSYELPRHTVILEREDDDNEN